MDKTQTEQVIEAMRNNGGFATLRRLNEILDFSSWKTKTPEASVRRIVQDSKDIFKIQPGLWALEDFREDILKRFKIEKGKPKSEEQFTHGYYQGLLLEIGKYERFATYIPAQDKGRLFLDKKLGDISDSTEIPKFTYDELLRKAKTVDVIWFNERHMPAYFYEVEHSTDIKNSLSKYYELQDFYANFFIVADKSRENEFSDKLHVSMFNPIVERVKFISYEKVAKRYEAEENININRW
jgi:hypothetical protein